MEDHKLKTLATHAASLIDRAHAVGVQHTGVDDVVREEAKETDYVGRILLEAVSVVRAGTNTRRMNKKEYLEFVGQTLDSVKALIERKNNDYTGGETNADPFANFRQAEDFAVHPLTGLSIRMGDKFNRIKAFAKDGKLAVPGEGVEDAFRDLIGYSLIALGMLAEERRNSGQQ